MIAFGLYFAMGCAFGILVGFVCFAPDEDPPCI